MKVSIRHGHGIPKNEDILVPYGFGWDERERQYGEGKGGKTRLTTLQKLTIVK